MKICCENERSVAIRFCDAEESAALNKEYRKKPKPTDVLSFSAFAQNIELIRMGLGEENAFSLGDLSVCVPVCYLQAKEHRVSMSSEMERMIVHGICHLKGFDHERSQASFEVMEALEISLRKSLVREMGKPNWATVMEIA